VEYVQFRSSKGRYASQRQIGQWIVPTNQQAPACIGSGVPEEQAARDNGIYRPFWESDFCEALTVLKTSFEGFTFVDMGSGKGKLLLLLASDYPFARNLRSVTEMGEGLDAVNKLRRRNRKH
jgi:hypothetical protein